jgi:uncharacterized protein (UPF0548 family)
LTDLTYAPAGVTRGGTLPGFRLLERTAVVGHGDAHWAFATREIMRWGIKTRSGFRVNGVVEAGTDATIIAFGIIPEPVRIVYTVDEPDRCGYAYGTLPGHPLRGEELFLLERTGDEIALRIRSFSRPANAFWWAMYPVLRLIQAVVVRRYLVALKSGH